MLVSISVSISDKVSTTVAPPSFLNKIAWLPAGQLLAARCVRNTSTQREQVNLRHSQEIHLLALRANKSSSFKQRFALC